MFDARILERKIDELQRGLAHPLRITRTDLNISAAQESLMWKMNELAKKREQLAALNKKLGK